MSQNSPQSERLKQFIQHCGMSVTQFGKQCGFASSSTLHNVISLGKSPSQKVLEKIIKRFPQLNYDWVVLGYGEMIVKGFEKNPVSANSLQMSTDASFGTIQESLRNHDYSLNELAKMINTAILKSEQTNEILISKLDSLVDKQTVMHELFFEKAAAKTIERDELIRTSLQKHGDDLVQRVMLKVDQKYEHWEKIAKNVIAGANKLIEDKDAERRELRQKEMQVLFEQFDRLAKRTEQTAEEINKSLTENTVKAIEELSRNSNKNTKDAIDYLGKLSKTKKI